MTSNKPDETEATKARKKAETDLARRKAEGNRVKSLLREWERIREQNSIAANFTASIKGRRP